MLRLLLILLASVLTIGFNIYAVTAPLYGVATQQVSAENEVLFTPAGFTFAVWGVIYAGLISFAVYVLIKNQAKSEVLRNATLWFVIAAGANITWLHFWHSRQIEISLIAMITLLFCLINVYSALKIGVHKHSLSRNLFLNLPISIYLGWISVATIANVAIVLDKIGWGGFGVEPTIWTAIMIVVAGGLGCYMLLKRKDFGYATVILWALFGIYSARSEVSLIANAILIAGAAILITSAYTALVPLMTDRQKSFD